MDFNDKTQRRMNRHCHTVCWVCTPIDVGRSLISCLPMLVRSTARLIFDSGESDLFTEVCRTEHDLEAFGSSSSGSRLHSHQQ